MSIQKRTTTEEFITKACGLYGNRFDYSKTIYTTLKNKIEIICKEHGSFMIYPHNHLTGNGGCRECSRNKPITTIEYIQRAIAVHGNLYDYSKTQYISARNKVTIICPKHGEFQVVANEHIRKDKNTNCKKCVHDSKRLTNEEFISKSIEKHGNMYDYSLVDYQYSDQKVKIICPKHGLFHQIPASHISGRGCAKCIGKISKAEIAWLNSMHVKIENRQKILVMDSKKTYVVDGYDPETNTVYEFNGDYWHGNPAKYNPNNLNEIVGISFGELFENTQIKLRELIENGYNVVSIWESDFRKN